MNIIELLKSPEGKTIEFKRDLSSHLGIVRTLIAFANTAGGTLVIGVEDKTRHIIGVPNPLALEEKIANLINDLIAPQILPDIEIFSIKKTQVVAVRVHPSPNRPHYLKNHDLKDGTYIRVGSTNRSADTAMIQELKRFATNQTYDEEPLIKLRPEAIDFEAASTLFSPFRKLKMPDLEILRLLVEHQGKIVPTVGGMLLFGKKREQYFPDAWIQGGRFFGITKSKIEDTIEIRSYPVLAIEEAFKFVQKHATMALEINEIRRTERWNIPLQAIREAIINAVIHADYSQAGAPIRLSIFQDRIEIENPGLLPFGLTLEEIAKGVSKLRNRIIGRVFNELKLVEQWGSGIQRIISACEENGLEKPTFEEIGTHFRVTIYTQQKQKPLLDRQDQYILNLLKNAESLAPHDIAKNIKLSPRATRTRLLSLFERGLITQIGSGPTDPTKRYFLRNNNMNNLLSIKFVMDSMILDLIASEEDPDINAIMQLIKKHDLLYCFLIPYSVKEEIENENTPINVKNILFDFLHTREVELSSQEKEQWLKLFDNAKGNAKKENVLPDLQHIAEAAKYGNYFITLDERLIKKEEKIKQIFPHLTLISPSEALKKLRDSLNTY